MQTDFSIDLYTTFIQVATPPCPGLNVWCLELAAMHRLEVFIIVMSITVLTSSVKGTRELAQLSIHCCRVRVLAGGSDSMSTSWDDGIIL